MRRAPHPSRRRGVTLAELMIGMMLMIMIAAGTAALSRAARLAGDESSRLETEAQTGRVVLERIR